MHPRHVVLIILFLTLVISGQPTVVAAQESSSTDVKALIEQLGHDNYLVRSRAREQLQQLGLEAFDELQAARFHHDSEVVTAARYLISSLLVSWSKETDPAPVRKALSEYGAQEPSERASRIELLAKLPSRQGLEALVRLVRFEPDPKLSRMAALALMEQPMSKIESVRRRHSDIVLNVIKDSDRQATQWLRVYAKDLATDSYSVDDWRELLRRQRREIDAATSQQASRASVLELVRICAARAAKSGERAEAIRLATKNIDLIRPTTRDLVEACSWAIDNKLHEFVLSLRGKNARIFDAQPQLLYGAAEAERIAGNEDAAGKLADQALAINAFPVDEKEKDKLSDNDIEEIAQSHLLTAEILSERGLYDWAEREYRHIVDAVDVTSGAGITSRGRLANMLGELLRHDDVVETLSPLIDRINKDDKLRQRLGFSRFNLEYYRSELEFHRGMSFAQKGKVEEAKKHLKIAYDAYPANVDILIAMFHINGDEDWQQVVLRDLSKRMADIESDIRTYEARVQQRGQRPDDIADLSQALNEYAWLVSNTAGDYQRALRESLRSLELTPDDAAKVDTCARCYLTLGQLDKAAETQRYAIELMPHSPPMIRQLEEIEQRLKQRDAEQPAS